MTGGVPPRMATPAIEIRRPRVQQRALLPDQPRGWLLAVEGPIGVGKTTVAAALAERFGASLLLEVVEENPFLREFYQDIAAKAFQTQIFFLLSRYRQGRDASRRVAAGAALVADYMFAKDRLFASLTLADAELALYDHVYEVIAPQVASPDVIVYLRASVATLLARITARGRSFERDLAADYLARLVAAYDGYFEGHDAAPVVVVDTERLDARAASSLGAVVAAVGALRRTPR